MPQYELKTDSRELEIASPEQSPDHTDIVIRLWGPDRKTSLSWKTDSVLVYMIADLVAASHGQIGEESPAIMGAHFDTSRQAIVAARRIQTSILEFLACRPGERVGSAILIYRPNGGDPIGLSAETIQQTLRQARPGQILLTANISQCLRQLPGTELRDVPALSTVMGDRQTKLTELLWTTPERIALFQNSTGDADEAPTTNIPPVGATVIVHSPLARTELPNEVPPSVVTKKRDVASAHGSETALKDLPDNQSTSLADGLDQFGERPFLTRTKVILGLVAIVLVAAIIAVLYRPAHVSQGPIPMHQEQTATPDIPGKQPQPDAASQQPEQKIVKTETAKLPPVQPAIRQQAIKTSRNRLAPSAATAITAQTQIADKTPVDAKSQSQKDIPDTPSIYVDEAGGVSVKDIPVLLRMAQQDAGAGNYDKARTEYRKILRLQPNNQDAKDGLRKLDLIQKEQ